MKTGVLKRHIKLFYHKFIAKQHILSILNPQSSILLFLFLVLPLSGFSQQARILNYSSKIQVTHFSEVKIVETISLDIFYLTLNQDVLRFFNMNYNNLSNPNNIEIKIHHVLIDGAPVKYYRVFTSKGMELKIDTSSQTLLLGRHTIVIDYSVFNALNILPEYNELTWSVTGGMWSIPIEHTDVELTLPKKSIITRYEGRAGMYGGDIESHSVQVLKPSLLNFMTMRTLNPFEDFSISVRFNGGLLYTPILVKLKILKEISASWILMIGLIILLIYYGFLWFHFCRNPKIKRNQYHAYPPNFSSAGCYFLLTKSVTIEWYATAIALIQLAVKGAVKIEDNNNALKVYKCSGFNKSLSMEENYLLQQLFLKDETSVEFSPVYHNENKTLVRRFNRMLKLTFMQPLIKSYYTYTIVGWSMILLLVVMTGWLLNWKKELWLYYAVLWISAFLFKRVLFFSLIKLKHIMRKPFSFGFLWLQTLLIWGALFFSLMGISFIMERAPLLLSVLIFILFILQFFMRYVLLSYTPDAKNLRCDLMLFDYSFDEKNDEKKELPIQDNKLFNRYFPYVILLNHLNEWEKKNDFNTVKQGVFEWYSNNDLPTLSHGNLSGYVVNRIIKLICVESEGLG